MSYRITVWCNDANVYKTSVSNSQIGYSDSYTYGDGRLDSDRKFSISGISGITRFTAEPAPDCTVVGWYYRLGSITGTQNWIAADGGSAPQGFTVGYDKNGNSTITYSGEQDIFIRAVGESNGSSGPVGSEWHPWESFNLGTADDGAKSADLFYVDANGEDVNGIGERQLHYGTVTFNRSGYVHFYSTSNLDLIGFLSDSPELAEDGSEPASILASDDDSGYLFNFDIEYYVTPGEYFLFVRGVSGSETGPAYVTVTEPWDLNDGYYGTLYGEEDEEVYLDEYAMCRRSVSFPKSGRVTLCLDANFGKQVWVSESSVWRQGYPSEELYYEYGAGAGPAFLVFDVVAGQEYYIWFRSNFNTAGYIKLNISEVEETIVVVQKWDWNASNGRASADETYDAYYAVQFHGRATDFSHLVWNDLVGKTQEFLDCTGRGTWTIGDNNYGYAESTTYTDLLSNAKMSASDTKLYAQKFNILRFCIGVMATFNNSTENNAIYQHYIRAGSWDMFSEEIVLGAYILALADKINQIE